MENKKADEANSIYQRICDLTAEAGALLITAENSNEAVPKAAQKSAFATRA